MNLYLLERTDEADYEEVCGYVIAANSDVDARRISKESNGWNVRISPDELRWKVGPIPDDRVTCTLLGKAEPGIEAGIILCDFLHG